MPRSIWSGAISFGLVTVPVHVASATEDHSVRFHQYHLEDMARVRVRKFCEVEDREVRSDEIAKGYELTTTQVIPITDEDLRHLPLPTAKALEIHGFVPWGAIDPLRIGEGYYLQPGGQVAAKPYELLRQALARSARVAVTKFAWSGRERLGLLRVRDDVIVLHAMRWPDEVRDPSELHPPAADVSDAEVDEAVELIERMTTDRLEGPDFVDHYTEALEKVIEAKREDHALPEVPEPENPAGKVLDLMAALRESVDKAKASRGEETGADAEVHEMPAKKTTAKAKAPAKQAAAKKATTAKKATAVARKAGGKKAAARRPRRSA
ncbi:Ku protein [Streptomyces sp. NPDC001068]|uniref:non-homologous end joining protein Ku n=1 Tax=Streptomyces sp. NPDC001068 TaxID=3364544 RepID=UPI00368EB762